jgi:uncharacterized protein YdeI (YjbR/CyaY-like superfamily)
MPAPKFFKTPQHFSDWLAAHAATELELLVGYYKVDSGQPSMTWSESVDEALCYGWIDGVRKRIDNASYTIRFTPRKTTSIWSAVNINKFNDLQQQCRMTPAGEKAFSFRTDAKSRIYAFEQTESAELSAEEMQAFKCEKPLGLTLKPARQAIKNKCCTRSPPLKKRKPERLGWLNCWNHAKKARESSKLANLCRFTPYFRL